MQNPFINLRSYSKSPQQVDPTQQLKFQTQPTPTLPIYHSYIDQKTTPFTTELPLKDFNKMRQYPMKQSYVKPQQNQKVDIDTQSQILRKSIKVDIKPSNDENESLVRQKPRSSSTWCQNQVGMMDDKSQPKPSMQSHAQMQAIQNHINNNLNKPSQPLQSNMKQSDVFLIKENESLRLLVNNLQLQVKTIKQRELSQRVDISDKHITEVDEEKENSSRAYIDELDRQKKQIANEREKFHQVVMDLEKIIKERDEQLLQRNPQQITQNFQDEMKMLLKENDNLNEIIEIEIKEREMYLTSFPKYLFFRADQQNLKLQTQLTEMKQHFDQFKETLTKEFQQSQQVVKDYENQLRELKQRIQPLLVENQDLKQRKEHSDNLFQDQQSYVNELEMKSQDLLVQNNEITQLCNDMQIELNQYKENLTHQSVTQTELARIHDLFQLSQNDLNQSRLIQRELEEQLNRQKLTDQEVQNKLRNLNLRIENYQNQIDQLNEKIKNQQDSIQKQRIKHLESEQTKEKLRRENSQTLEQLEASKRQCESLKRDKDKIYSENEQLMQMNLQRKTEFDLLFDDLEELQNQIIVLTKENDTLQNEQLILEQRIQKDENQKLESMSNQFDPQESNPKNDFNKLFKHQK